MFDAGSISEVLDVTRPEREALLVTLREFDIAAWSLPTECPAYSVKGIASHVLGDDLSLLSRQRDAAQDGLSLLAAELPGTDFRTMLDAFNDRWVAASQFLSPELLIELLRLSGDWTATYYEQVDPLAPGEPVGLFGGDGESSPFWHAIAREYLERWVHHSQILRALGRGPLADERFVRVGVAIVGVIARMEPECSESGEWSLGPVMLGDRVGTADILTRGLTADEVRAAVSGPRDVVDVFAAVVGRP